MSYTSKRLLAAGSAIISLTAFTPHIGIFHPDHACAQATAQGTMTVNASVSNPLALKVATNPDGGSFAIGGGGTVKITPGGGSSISGGFIITAGQVGQLTITAPQSATFSLSVPTYKASDIKITNGGGGASSKSITVQNIKLGNVTNLSGVTGTMAKGSAALGPIKVTSPVSTGKIAIGISLLFGANQVEGLYSGTYTLRITF